MVLQCLAAPDDKYIFIGNVHRWLMLVIPLNKLFFADVLKVICSCNNHAFILQNEYKNTTNLLADGIISLLLLLSGILSPVSV